MTKYSMPVVKFATIKAVNASGMPWQQRYVLLQLWELADARTGIISRPYSYRGLATFTGMSERAIKNHVKACETEGWLEVIRPGKADAIRKHVKNRYRCIPRNHASNHRGAVDAQHQDRLEAEPQVTSYAFNAPVQQMPTSQETTTSTITPPDGGDRDPLICMTCQEKIWDCSCMKDHRWICTCGEKIWLRFEGDGTEVFFCETCGELTKVM